MRKKISFSIISMTLLIGLAVILSVVANYSRQQAMKEIQESSSADLNRYILILQQKLARYRDIPELLSTHPDLIKALRFENNTSDIIRANIHLAKVNEILATRDSYLMNKNGLTIAASSWQSDKSFVGREFSYRPYFINAIAGGLGQYFALGTTSQKRGFYFSRPVFYKKEIIGVVVVKIDLNEIEKDWNEDRTELLISDKDGVIFLATRENWKFKTLTTLQAKDLTRIGDSKRYIGQALQPLNITKRRIYNRQESEAGKSTDEIITLNEAESSKTGNEYLVQTDIVGSSDLNVSIFTDLGTVQRRVIANFIYVGTVYFAIVLLVMVVIARRRITKQKSLFEQRELQALERSEAKVTAIINNTRAGLITLNINGYIESMNVTAQKLFGHSEQELKGTSFSLLLSEIDRPLFNLQISQTIPYEEKLLESAFTCRDKTQLPVEFVIGQMRQQGQEGLQFLITLQDITERKQYEKQLEQSQLLLESRVEKRTIELTSANDRLLEEIEQHSKTQNELIQTAKLAVIGQMSAGINHELNQPLMAIRGYADNARKFLALDKVATVDSNLIEIALLTERMAKILHPLKEFSRKSSGLQQPVSVSQLRQGVFAILYPRLEKSSVEVCWLEPDEGYYILGELLRLEQVMVNLIGNAMQAVENEEQPSVIINQQVNEDGFVEITVRDNGVGISDLEAQRIFEPFYTTKKEGQGLGLGLSISQRIIEEFGGTIIAKSIVNPQQNRAINSNNDQADTPPSLLSIQGAEFKILLKKGTS